MTIIYRTAAAARFDWAYYLTKHLPLAVGTSMRHSAITGCDCDRPLDNAHSPVVCLCVVHFADRSALEAFAAFFATAHPESGDIIADEPNYTAITPCFVGSAVQADARSAGGNYRVRLLLPHAPGDARERDQDLRDTLLASRPDLDIETDFAIGSVPLDAAPAYDPIWSFRFATREAAVAFARCLGGRDGKAVLRSAALDSAIIVASEVVLFDLAHAVQIRDRAV